MADSWVVKVTLNAVLLVALAVSQIASPAMTLAA